jgi:predicted MPP superfamily phosphohydrolase
MPESSTAPRSREITPEGSPAAPTSSRLPTWKPGNLLHNALLALDLPRRLPLPALGLLVVALFAPVTFLYVHRGPAALVLALASGLDLALLVALPRLRVSFGPVGAPWLIFAAGRAAAGALLGLLPLSSALQVGLLALGQLALSAAAAWGSLVEPFRLEQARLTLPIRGLAGQLRVLLLSDLHLERLTRREAMVLEATRKGKPDLILIAGDLLNLSYLDDQRALEELRGWLGQLSAPAGVLLVRGTAEVDPPDIVQRALRGLDVQWLEGGCQEVKHGSAKLQVIGLPADRPPGELAELLGELHARCRPGPRLCLHHTPDLIPQAARLGFDLYLAGHTHGGQICLPVLGPLATASRLGRRYFRGYHCVGTMHAYVSRGIGLEGLGAPRMRFLARPELVWLTLVPG